MNGEMTISISAENFKRFKELAGLNEKQSRLFFGLYSMNLGRGGPKKVAEHFRRWHQYCSYWLVRIQG